MTMPSSPHRSTPDSKQECPPGRATPRALSRWASRPCATMLLLALLTSTLAPASPNPASPNPVPAPVPVPAPQPALQPVPAHALRVTTGHLQNESGTPLLPSAPDPTFFVRSPALRAWLGHTPRSSAELAFKYLGPTRDQAPLASGELRRQVGLELRAQNGCNLLYVMWRIEPVQALLVSLKSNPGQQLHRECGDRGYLNLVPERSEPLPALRAGERHVLRASIAVSAGTGELTVWVDGRPHWQGRLPPAALAFDGPAGVRSDNAELELQLRSTELAP